MEIDIELRQNILDLLYIIQYLDAKQLYESQDYYTALLPLIFDSNFREKINDLRARLNIPHEWYRKMRDDVGAAWEEWLDINPQAPKEPTHSVIINLAFELDLDPIRYGMFLLDYLYFSSIDIENMQPIREEFKGKVHLVDTTKLSDSEQAGLYIKIYKDTTRTSLEQFFMKNEPLIQRLQKNLIEYPVNRVRSAKTFKRDLEIFLFYALNFSAGQIGAILSGLCDDKLIERFKKENEEYIAELPSLMSTDDLINIIRAREYKLGKVVRSKILNFEIESLSDEEIRTIVSNFRKDFHITPNY